MKWLIETCKIDYSILRRGLLAASTNVSPAMVARFSADSAYKYGRASQLILAVFVRKYVPKKNLMVSERSFSSSL